MSQTVWNKCVDRLQGELPAQQFNTWIRPLQVKVDQSTLRLLAPNRFVLDWISQRYLARINEIVGELDQSIINVEIVIGSQRGEQTSSKKTNSVAKVATVNKPSAIEEPESEGVITHQSGLNKAFTFSTFVEGKSNQLARAAAASSSRKCR